MLGLLDEVGSKDKALITMPERFVAIGGKTTQETSVRSKNGVSLFIAASTYIGTQ